MQLYSQRQPAITLTKESVQLSDRIPVRVEFIPEQDDTLPHNHDFAEIALVTSGRARHLTRYGDDPISSGSVLVLNPGQTHAFSQAENCGLINIYYLPQWFLDNLRALQDIDSLAPLFFQRTLARRTQIQETLHFKINPAEMETCRRELQDLERESLRQPPQSPYLEACLLKSLIVLARAYLRSLGKHRKNLPQPDLHPAVAFALQRLETDAAQGLIPNMEDIAQQCGISFSYFCRLFKEHTGSSATAYFQRRRINRASHRLLTSRASVAQIAYNFGYADSAHFSRMFKAIQGIAPSEYRARFWNKATPKNNAS